MTVTKYTGFARCDTCQCHFRDTLLSLTFIAQEVCPICSTDDEARIACHELFRRIQEDSSTLKELADGCNEIVELFKRREKVNEYRKELRRKSEEAGYTGD